MQSPDFLAETGKGLVEIISRYTQTFLLLQRYDKGLLTDAHGTAGGMKAHIRVDRDSGLVHSMVATSANISDVTQAHHQMPVRL